MLRIPGFEGAYGSPKRRKKVKYPNIKLTALMLAAVLTAPVCTAATGDIYNYEFTALGTTISSQIKADNKEKAQFCANVVKKRGLTLR